MALADSVPGVSGGTIAFILGFYDRFLDSLHALFGKDRAERKAALIYLAKLGAGWGIGMITCVLALSGMFEKNIYFMSSLFLVLTVASLPFIIIAERPALKRLGAAPFTVLGIAIVVGLTALRVGATALGKVSFSLLSPLSLLYIFLAGAVAITAMVLPGISGSSILLIAGVYLPAVQAVKAFLGLDFSVLPGLLALGFGVIAGVGLSIHGIREALRKCRSQMVWLILGLMLGSTYAIANGPCWIDTSVPLLIANPTDYSFPSGHTLSSVISAVILAKTDRRFGYAAIPLAVLIAFSRLYLYVHFPSDVLASAVLGIIIGHLIFRFGDSLLNKLKAPRLRAKS